MDKENCEHKNTIRYGINYQNRRQKLLCKDCGKIILNGSIDKKGTEPQKAARQTREPEDTPNGAST